MDKAITTALLIVISMVMALMLFNTAYPAIIQGGDAIASMANHADEQMRSQIAVIHAAAEVDSSGAWQDTDGSGDFDVFVWVKNLGDTRISGVERMDVFFGPEGDFARVPYQTDAGGNTPYWTWQIENAADWIPTATLRIAIHYGTALASGRYFIRVTTPTGISADDFLGI